MPLKLKTRFRIARGGYEKAERDLARQLMRSGDQVLECGASIGILSSILVKIVQPGGRVVSVEPNLALRNYFDHQMAINDINDSEITLVHGLCCPIWQANVPEKWRALGFAQGGNSLEGKATGQSDGTPWYTLESVARDYDLKPTVLMIDIEGAEAVWTEHAPQFPPSVRLVIAEFHPEYIGATTVGAAVEAVLAEGFRIAGLRRNVVAFERESTPS
jgi:FkbM family methyltransferase